MCFGSRCELRTVPTTSLRGVAHTIARGQPVRLSGRTQSHSARGECDVCARLVCVVLQRAASEADRLSAAFGFGVRLCAAAAEPKGGRRRRGWCW